MKVIHVQHIFKEGQNKIYFFGPHRTLVYFVEADIWQELASQSPHKLEPPNQNFWDKSDDR